MPYLSRVWINPLRTGARVLLQNPQAMHAAVLGGIPVQPVTERVLWRLDEDEPRRPALFVLSRSAPSWEHLVEQAGWAAAQEPQAAVRSYDGLLDKITGGRSFAFRLTANPTQARAPKGGGKSVRHGHRTAEHQLRWLLDRVEGWGFEVPVEPRADGPAVRVVARARRQFSRKRGTPPVSLQVVTYEGRMIVHDPEALRAQMLAGFGRAKAYGCGLMTLAPDVRST